MTDKNEITYTGNGQVNVALRATSQVCKIRKGDVVKRGDIPNDAFNALAKRPEFGGDFDEWAASRSRKPAEVERALLEPVAPRETTGGHGDVDEDQVSPEMVDIEEDEDE